MMINKKLLTLIAAVVITLCLVFASIVYAESAECGIGTAVRCSIEENSKAIPYETKYVSDPKFAPENGNNVIQEGKDGADITELRITYENGVPNAVETIGTRHVEPVTEIVYVPDNNHRTETKEVTDYVTVYYKTKTVEDPSRKKGDPDKIIQEGVNGKKMIVYKVTYVDGVETSRTVKSERITEAAVDKIISVATGKFNVSYETETVVIPFVTVYEDAPNWNVGYEKVTSEGSNGTKEVTYEVHKDDNGNIISRTVSNERIIHPVVNKVISRGTFNPIVTYEVVSLPNLPECDANKRDDALNSACIEWAWGMAQADIVMHAPNDIAPWGESVGAWSTLEGVIEGRDYTVISTQDGQTYNGNVSLGSHGGQMLAEGSKWGAGCVKRMATQPDGTVETIFFACARSLR